MGTYFAVIGICLGWIFNQRTGLPPDLENLEKALNFEMDLENLEN